MIMGRRWVTPLCLCLAVVGATRRLPAQEITGRVVDARTGRGVSTAGVYLMSEQRSRLAVTIADSLGQYILKLPARGEYVIQVERIGYAPLVTPLFEVAATGSQRLDLEVTPLAVELDPLEVTVRNETMQHWLLQRFEGNPAAMRGFRSIQGARLEEARLRSEDNTDMLRWLYIPVSHGETVCLGSRMPKYDRARKEMGPPRCGRLFVDGVPVPAEHLDQVDMKSIALVLTFDQPLQVFLFTRSFDWSRPP